MCSKREFELQYPICESFKGLYLKFCFKISIEIFALIHSIKVTFVQFKSSLEDLKEENPNSTTEDPSPNCTSKVQSFIGRKQESGF